VTRRRLIRLFGWGLALAAAGAAAPEGPQIPRVHYIDLYGTGKITAARILREAKLETGQPLPASKGDLEERINQIAGISRVRVEAICCEGPDAVLFVGVEEKDGPRVSFRSEPMGKSVLPADLVDHYQQFVETVAKAVEQKISSDQVEISLANAAHGFEAEFTAFADEHAPLLRDVLRNTDDAEQRAIAAAVIGYAPKKAAVADDLQYALQDPDETVRGNAMRSLKALAIAGVRDSSLGIRISPTWLIELLNSLVLNDRLQAADLLLILSDQRETAVLDQMRQRALPSLAEMARWETLRYALPPFLLVGRIAGFDEEEIQRLWSSGEREIVIQRALGKPGARRK